MWSFTSVTKEWIMSYLWALTLFVVFSSDQARIVNILHKRELLPSSNPESSPGNYPEKVSYQQIFCWKSPSTITIYKGNVTR